MVVSVLPKPNEVQKAHSLNGYQGKSITETVINGFFTVDRKWTVKYWNKAAEKLLKVEAKDIVGRNIWEKFAGIIPLDFYMVYHKAFLQDIPVHFQEYWGEMGAWYDVITYHCDDTLSVSFKSSNKSVDPANQENQKKPEQQQQIISALYRFVTEVTNDCLWEWELQTSEIFWIDGGHKRIFGYDIENAFIPRSFWESCLHPDDKERMVKRTNSIIAEESSSHWEDEYRFKKANGDYAFVHDRGHIIYEDGLAVRMIGATQDITKSVLLENKLSGERQTKQREITEAVLSAQEKERAEIGKELHDNLNQILAVTKLYIQMAKTYGKDRDLYLEKSREYIGDVMNEIRRISKSLVIPGIHIIGLFDNINNLITDLEMILPIEIVLEVDNLKEKDLDEKMQMTIFRIVQEQMNNILKHSKATRATINLSRQENEIVLHISDNGEGCDISKEVKGVGIINIRSRAELYHGGVTVVSRPGEGYVLEVILPLNEVISVNHHFHSLEV